MARFTKEQTKELNEFLCNCCYIHDAKIDRVMYKQREKELMLNILNFNFNVKFNLIICGIEILLATKGNYFGDSNTILSLTLEDISYWESFSHEHNMSTSDSLYMLFQMFSGDELHVVFKEIIITEQYKTDDGSKPLKKSD
ncbi:MAG: hypothetical protein IJ025_07610 [Clostridia bacterium]|nr:hypothetical protein [Clostridia bacterium]